MNHLIYLTLTAIQTRINQCNDILRPTWTDGITNNYALPIKHATEELWALVIDPAYEFLFTPEEIASAVELTADWFPPMPEMFNTPTP